MEQDKTAAEAAHEAHTLPHLETVCFEPNVPEKRRNEIKPYAVAPLCFWKPARKDLEPHPARGGDIFTAWRRRTLILWNRLCSALNLAAYAPCLGNRQICLFVILCGFTCHTALYCCCCSLHSFGSWWLGNGSVFPPYVLDVTIRDSLLGSAPGPGDMLNEFLHRLGPVAHGTLGTMIYNSFANGSLPGSWKVGDAISIPKPGKDPCRPVSYRPITLLSALPKLTEGMIRRRLSALLPQHPRQFGFAPSRSASDVATLVIDKITRGLNEFGTVEYERPGDDAPTGRPRRHRSLVVLIDISTVFDTIDHGKLFGMLDRLLRLGLRTKRWLHNYMRGRRVSVCTREQHSRKQLASAGAPQGGVPGSKLFLYCVDDLPHRMGNIYSAASFMHADDLTLVASGADIHACAAAMQPALSLTTTWAAEHNLKINVAKSEAALFYISSRTHGLTRKWSISILAMVTYVFSHAHCACWKPRLIAFLILARTPPPLQSRPCHAAINCDWSHGLVRPITPCDSFRLDTSTVCHCIVTRQLSHALPTTTSVIWKYGNATVVKHLFSLAQQRKIHLST
ncbi:hypothetical protein TCDM_12452 [Trypanosoma cruzi Dm28c]|uniref:Reverse transcriptase domain-containing protein n=2 Tax=Trypanosoma cruzi TaxID=5693 RepID=V5CNF5_TRYCR|nr:hypothetical protein TCDM_12452 [Trypanosoma cruzi Dm28c]PWV01895.1 hypothetical protein C4B63_3g872 [Trypanosoma cruzi]